MAWLLLAGAIVCEVGGTLSLRVAATGRRGWYLLVFTAYVAAFSLLGLALAGLAAHARSLSLGGSHAPKRGATASA